MIEYQDGTFSEIMPRPDAEELFGEIFEQDEGTLPAALHVGSEEDLQERKEKRTLEERVSDLEESLEEQPGTRSSIIDVPSDAEISAVLKEHVTD